MVCNYWSASQAHACPIYIDKLKRKCIKTEFTEFSVTS